MKEQKNQFCIFLAFVLVISGTSSFVTSPPLFALQNEAAGAKQQAEQILKACNVKGGLIVHIQCGDGRLTAALRANERYLVHGLDRSESHLAQARQYIQSLGVYGVVSVEKFQGNSLPYIDNLVNLVVSENLDTISKSEVMRFCVRTAWRTSSKVACGRKPSSRDQKRLTTGRIICTTHRTTPARTIQSLDHPAACSG